MGTMLSSLGRHEEAYAASKGRGVDIRRVLAGDRPDAFIPARPRENLRNLSLRLSDLGRREEALAASMGPSTSIAHSPRTDQTPSCRASQ